ncbi:hypothetical protein CI109_102322 [Kwoniella shandongensis]|uniref:Uncharacterized protein n=1 Tax=Kwoniella shandongensis TaxID=1734106 RepID=A0A5M6BTP9_9TREE|nr:uncharacterized protein CI109_005349 [Kwoniella shandongensis]KAA5526226.1 hypothetical protein CI109_005349 [Kwoniella shandongensis]
MSSLFTPLLWSFLPSQLTHTLLPYLSSYFPALLPAAPRNTSTYNRNYRLVFTGVVCVWLAYSFVTDEERTKGEDWYSLLGVDVGVDDDGLKRAFRSLSRLHHPDRAGAGNDDQFIMIRRAYETLSDPVKRYAYDRFGPQVLEWKAASVREYIHTGLARSVGFYLVSGGIMLLLSLLGRVQEGSYWRQTLFAVLLTFELLLILSPTSSLSLPSLLNPFRSFLPRNLTSQPQFKQINLLHRLFTSLSVGITQLAAAWTEPKRGNGTEEEWKRVIGMLRGLEMDAITGFQSEVVPVLSSGNAKNVEALIQSQMEEVVVQRSISSHPHIRPAWQAAISQDPTRKGIDMRQRQAMVQRLEMAKRVPLPPSPPPSPRLGTKILR